MTLMIKAMLRFIIFFPLMLLIFIVSCDLKVPTKDDLASWTTRYEIPMLDKTIVFDDIIEDSLISPMDGSSLYGYTKEINIDTVKVDEKLNLDDIHKNFSQSVDDISVEDSEIEEKVGFNPIGIDPVIKNFTSKIGNISLNNIPEEETVPYSFSSIYPDINSFPDGTWNIPSFLLEPVINPFSFDDFSHAEFISGNLTISIENNLVIPLGNQNINLQHTNGTNILEFPLVILGPINTGETSSATLNLSGLSLPGNIRVEVTGSSPGENGVLIDESARNSSFLIKISGSDMVVSSATAKIPEQSIFNSDTIELEADSNKVQSATISNGELIISIDNHMSVSSVILMNIPTILTPNDVPFSTTINIDGNETGIVSEVSINEHSLHMDINDQFLQYNYTVNTIDSGDQFLSVNSSDSIEISISLRGEGFGEQITFSHFTGNVSPQNLGFSGEINLISDSSQISEAILDGGLLSIHIQNDINVMPVGSPNALITIPELKTVAGNTFSIFLDHISGTTDELINLNGYSINMATDYQFLSYSADVSTNYDEIGEYSLNDSISIIINVSGLSFNQVSGYFSQDALEETSTITIEDSTQIETAIFNTGELRLEIDNNIGVFADIQFSINEFVRDGFELDTTFSLTPEGDAFVIDLAQYNLSLNISEHPQTVTYVSNITLPNEEEMTLNLNESINVDVYLQNMSFESVTGVINPMTVQIDPVVQKIDEFPDITENFEFTDVNMFIDFETDIGISVVLDLEIESSNPAGDRVISIITGRDITEGNRIFIPNADSLINIFPDSIKASGEATVSGTGTVTTFQFVTGKMTLEIPMIFNVPDSTDFDI